MDPGPTTAEKNAGMVDASAGAASIPPPLPTGESSPPPLPDAGIPPPLPSEANAPIALVAPPPVISPPEKGPTAAIPLRPGETASRVEAAREETVPPAPIDDWLTRARYAPSWLLSMIFHLAVFVALAWATVSQKPERNAVNLLSVGQAEQGESLDTLVQVQAESRPLSTMETALDTRLDTALPKLAAPAINSPPLELPRIENLLGRSGKGLAAVAGGPGGTGGTGAALSGRTDGQRDQMGKQYGATPGSEAAVERALKWLAAHQLSDGSWSFQHQTHQRCHGQCPNPGFLTQARVASTGMALLPFLGAGQTHLEGRYKPVVRTGIYYLTRQIRNTPQGGALNDRGGKMYSHGIASIALCEAYAMTHDKALAAPAQQVLNFIASAQDPSGGGWRYEPLQPGDTSVLGWQLMALKSGRMADLLVRPLVFSRASHFLDTVQSENGVGYGYLGQGDTPTTTAIGLLCRMYLGWKKDNPALARGVESLSNLGPSDRGDLYYDYYATQVMRHWGGEPWRKWNDALRDRLVVAQALKGHEAGSWYFEEGDLGSRNGGRLYCTAMAAMILEVYYRHLPLYGKRSIDEEFPD